MLQNTSPGRDSGHSKRELGRESMERELLKCSGVKWKRRFWGFKWITMERRQVEDGGKRKIRGDYDAYYTYCMRRGA